MSRRQMALDAFDTDDAGEIVIVSARDGAAVYHRPLRQRGDANDLLACRPNTRAGARLSRPAAEARGLRACQTCYHDERDSEEDAR